MKISHAPLLVSALFAFVMPTALADETAIAFPLSPYWTVAGPGQGVYGWQFTTYADIQVSSVGLYDGWNILPGGFIGDGLISSHQIGIWDVANRRTPLLTSLIPAGTIGTLISGFRYVSVLPTILPANHDYVIAALYNYDDKEVGSPNNPGFSLTVAPNIGFGGYRASLTSILTMPLGYFPGEEFSFGPNFTYAINVPEPPASVLGILSVAALLFLQQLRAPPLLKR